MGALLAVLLLAATGVVVLVTTVGASWSACGTCCCGGTPDDGVVVHTGAVQGFLLAGALLAAAGVALAAWLLLLPRWAVVGLAAVALVLVPLGAASRAGVDWRGCPTDGPARLVAPCGTATVALHRPASPVHLDSGQSVHQHLRIFSPGPFTLAVTPGPDQVSVRVVDLEPDPTRQPRRVTAQPSLSGTLVLVPDGPPSVWDIILTNPSAAPQTATVALHLVGPGRDQ